MKYPIDKVFFPFSHFAPPIRSAKTAGMMNVFNRTPNSIFKDAQLSVRREKINGSDGEPIEVFIMEPKNAPSDGNCLVYLHGGGFFFSAAGYHYANAKQYALQTPCKVIFVHYRLTPHVHFPVPVEDCYAAWLWTHENAQRLGVDKNRIAIGGDSAGGCLAAAVCQMARDRNAPVPRFQLLVYPVTDRRMNTESHRRFTDTPMWNSRLSVKMWDGYLPDKNIADIACASPMDAVCFADLPKAYVETAEFDCLHDEALAYAEALEQAGVSVETFETKGTMHGFDIVQKAPCVQEAIARRIQFMKTAFED